MLDHVFTDAIGALRDVFEAALLERQAFEERFQVDVLLGDMTWETSYGLPGEGLPPRVQADITLTWPTWAQSAYRSWYIGEPMDEPPRIKVEIVLRVQRLATAPDPALLPATLPAYFVGLRRGLGLGWMFVIAAELMGASKGLGFLLLDGQMTSRPQVIIGSLVLFAILGKLTDVVLVAVGDRFVGWQDTFKSPAREVDDAAD